MASAEAHKTIGWAAGAAAAALVIDAGASGTGHVQAALALLAGRLGGVFPDRIEEAWWTRKRIMLIEHRTVTHIAWVWLALLVLGHEALGVLPLAPVLLGFALGGCSHLAADIVNPMGIPLFWSRRYSLNLWKSGRADILPIALMWGLAAWCADRALLDGAGAAWAIAAARDLMARA